MSPAAGATVDGRPLRVLQVHNGQLTRGGSDTVIEREAGLLAGAGVAVDTWILPATGAPGLAGAVKPTWNPAAARTLAARVGAFGPDVVHVHTPFPLLSPAVFRTARRLGPATVGTMHSFRYSCIGATCIRDGRQCQDCVGRTVKLPGLVHRCYHDSYAASAALTVSLAVHHAGGTLTRAVDRMIALSPYTREVAVRDGLPARKVVVKPNSVGDPGPPAAGVGDGVLFMGRLVPQKGIEHLLRAWTDHGEGLPPLVVAGDGELRGLVEEAVRAGADVRFLGWLPEDELAGPLAACRLVVVPSLWQEAGPLVVLRALAAGRPVVVPDLDNFRGPGSETGAVVPYAVGDAAALAATVRRLAADPDPDARRRAARATFLEHYSDDANLAALLRIYAAARGERAGRLTRSGSA